MDTQDNSRTVIRAEFQSLESCGPCIAKFPMFYEACSKAAERVPLSWSKVHSFRKDILEGRVKIRWNAFPHVVVSNASHLDYATEWFVVKVETFNTAIAQADSYESLKELLKSQILAHGVYSPEDMG